MIRIPHLLLILATALSASGQGSTVVVGDPPPQQPVNILFINIDDMNDWTEMMGTNPQIQTPQMERLAEMGTYFTNAHCQYARCVQSRSSYMTGLYPETFIGRGVEGAVDGHEIKTAQGVVDQALVLGTQVMENYFKDHGYKTYMIGKIYHGRAHDGIDVDGGYGGGSAGTPLNAANFPGQGTGTDWGVYEEGEASDADMGDYQNASWIIDQLNNHPTDGQPFFMAIGFRLPHVPWYIPQKWADLYPADETLWKEPFYPELWQVNPDNGNYEPSPANTLPSAAASKLEQGYPNLIDPDDTQYVGEQGWRDITQAYAGSISFVDDQIGRLIDGLAASPHADNTVIVAFSDHGYHLGSKMIFTKHNLWDRSTQAPLFFAGPGIPADQMIDKAVELVDVYPTLLSLANLPPNPANEGDNLVPLMQNPGMDWDKPALIFHTDGDDEAVVKGDWRYITYDPTDPDDQELYDVSVDPYEIDNLAQTGTHQAKIDELKALLMPRPWMELEINLIGGEGTVTQDPAGPTYLKDEVVTLTVEPAPGFVFERWDGHAEGTETTTTIEMSPWHRTVNVFFQEQ